MDPLTLMAIATIATTGFSIYQQDQAVKAANAAELAGLTNITKGQNRRALEGFQRRRQQLGGTVLGGSPQAEAVSQQGTILTDASQKRSLLG